MTWTTWMTGMTGITWTAEMTGMTGMTRMTGMAPLYITELLSYRTCSRMLCSTDQKLLAVPKSRLKTYGDRAFSIAAPKLWNELPLDLRSLDTINLFKKHLKTDLFKKAYNV